jgi:uncharacterized membrane protein YgdD (TMEM256/DUF423 family)
MNSRFIFLLGCFSAALGVAAGAFGAHGLRFVLSSEMLTVYETAVRYQMYHAFGLIAAGLSAQHSGNSHASTAAWFFVAGTILFSGSLYAMTLSGVRWLGIITPFGGVAFIAGWLLLAFSFVADKSVNRPQ